MGKKEAYINRIHNVDIFLSDISLSLLKKPFLMLMAGSSQAGKTSEVLQWLLNSEKIFDSAFDKVTYIYGSGHQKSFDEPLLKHVEFTDNLESFYN